MKKTVSDQPDNDASWRSIRNFQSKDPLARRQAADALASLCRMPSRGPRRASHTPCESWNGDIDDPLMAALLPFSTPPTIHPARSIVFMEGQESAGIWLLCAGIVRLTRSSMTGKNITMHVAHAPVTLGLSAVIARDVLRMEAQTASPCGLAFLDHRQLFQLMNDSSTSRLITEALSRELQATYSDIGDLMLARSARGRLARVLLSVHADAGICSHQQLADLANCSRETVTRLMGSMQRRGLIEFQDGSLRLLDQLRIEAICD